MLRRSFGLFAAFCFVLCAGFATLWVREEPRVPPPPVLPPRLLPLVRVSPFLSRDLPDVDLARPMPALPAFRRYEMVVVLDWVSDRDARLIDVNWPAIEAAGMGPETLVSGAGAPSGTFGSRLADVLTPIGLAFASDGYHVYVSTPADVERLGHMRHVDRFVLTTRADADAAEALGTDRGFPPRRPPLVRVETDWQALRAGGARFDAPIGWRYYTPPGALLEAVLRQASGATPLRYQIRNGQVVISTAAALESADRHRTRIIAISSLGALVAFLGVMFLARRRRGLRRFVCVAFVLSAALVLIIPLWRARPDFVSARIGRSRWTVGLGPQRTFVLSREPERLEEVFVNHQSAGPRGTVYFNRLGFFAACDGTPYQIINAHAPRWEVMVLLGAVPFIWSALKVPAVVSLPRRLRERRRARAGQCLNCGYDLRGCPSDRCPECGAGAVRET